MRRAVDRTLLFLLVVVCTTIAANVRAQGTGGHVPDPADSRTLTRLLERHVSPTVPQWLEIETAHEAYLVRFARLREEDIARFLEFTRTSMDGVPDARTAREYLRRRKLVDRKIAEEDSRLVEEIGLILKEEQLPGLERFRQARERSRLGFGLSAPGASPVQDLWSVLGAYERDLGPEQMGLIDAELRTYEERLGAALRAWHQAQESMFLTLIEELQIRGLGELAPGDTSPEKAQQTVEAFQQALQTGQEESRAAAERVRKLNDRTIKTVEALLGEDDGRRIRMAYLEQESNKWIERDPVRIERTLSRILESDALDESTREAVTGLRRNYREVDDRYVNRLIEHCTQLSVLEGPLNDYGIASDAESPLGQQINEKRHAIMVAMTERGELAERIREQLRSLIEGLGSPELVAIVESGGRVRENAEFEEELAETLATPDVDRGGPTDFIPKRISRRDLERIREQLEPAPWQQAILSTIHEDYTDTWRKEVAPLAQKSAHAQSTVYAVEPKTLRRVGDPRKLQVAYEHALAASARAGEIDRAFFEDLHASLDKEQQGALWRTRLARELDRYLRGTDPIFNPAEVTFKPANVIETINELELTPEESMRVDEFLQARSGELLEAARVSRDIRLESERRMHELNMRMSVGMSDGTMTSTDHGIAYRKLSDEMAAAHGERISDWRRSHDAFVKSLGELLDAEHARDYKRAWKQASNPFVYRDPNAATIPVEQALGLSDISTEQIGAIGEVLTDYDAEWERLSSEMADLHAKMRDFGALTPPEEYEQWHELNERFMALSFQRNEASMRALRRLARYLEPEQRDRIRALRRLDD